jgi:hypothetical protein
MRLNSWLPFYITKPLTLLKALSAWICLNTLAGDQIHYHSLCLLRPYLGCDERIAFLSLGEP